MSDPEKHSIVAYLRDLGAATDSVEAEDEIAQLPRILRYGCWAHENRRNVEERLLAEISTIAPDLEAGMSAWAGDTVVNASTFAKLLDQTAAGTDRPVLRQLADCVRIVSVPDTGDCRHDHQRAASALTLAVDKFKQDHFSHPLLHLLETVVLGWASIVVGINRPRQIPACRVASDMAERRLNVIIRNAITEERDRVAASAMAERDDAPEDPQPAAKADGRHHSGECETEHAVRVCDIGLVDLEKRSKVRDVLAPHEHVIGCAVPLALTPDLAAVRRELAVEFPYATTVIDRMLSDLINRPFVKLKPTLLIGAPGSGKSRFARRLGDVLKLTVWRFDATQSDGAVFGGTARRWHSAEPCHAFLAISRAHAANPLITIDEIEKAATRQDYGRLWDAILGFLEPETAMGYSDPALQVNVDVSHVNYGATANSLGALPSPLRDRFRILNFPEPATEYLACCCRR